MAKTTINTGDIRDGSVTDAKIAAGTNIASSKLADGANFLKKDGSVAATGDFDAGTHKVVNLQTGTSSTDAVNKGQMDAAIAAVNTLFDSRTVRVGSTANVTVSNPGTSSFDGVTLSNGDRILLKNQTAPAENGIYVFNGSGVALTRATDMDAWAEVPGLVIVVQEGTANADTLWLSTANQGGTLGTTGITFTNIPLSAGGYSNSNFVDKETPSGTVNGSNTTFTLANTPTAGSEHVYLNGLLQESGSGNDYTISGSTITYLTAPATGDKIRVSYRK
jgi:hypothetical protein